MSVETAPAAGVGYGIRPRGRIPYPTPLTALTATNPALSASRRFITREILLVRLRDGHRAAAALGRRPAWHRPPRIRIAPSSSRRSMPTPKSQEPQKTLE